MTRARVALYAFSMLWVFVFVGLSLSAWWVLTGLLVDAGAYGHVAGLQTFALHYGSLALIALLVAHVLPTPMEGDRSA